MAHVSWITLVEAGAKYRITPAQIARCCNGYNKTAASLHWMYVDHKTTKKCTNEERKKRSESKINGNNPMAKAVICEDTGELFLSAYEAGRKYNVCGESISAACKKRIKTCCEKTWRYATYEEIQAYKNSITV